MSISINDSMYSYLTQTADTATSSAAASSVSSSLNNISSSSSEEEIKQAIKDFESYFVEQILKNVQESLTSDEGSSSCSQLTDYYMGTVNETLADKIVDQVGERLTQTLYEQMCRNYSIPIASETEAETETEVDSTEAAAVVATGAAAAEE